MYEEYQIKHDGRVFLVEFNVSLEPDSYFIVLTKVTEGLEDETERLIPQTDPLWDDLYLKVEKRFLETWPYRSML